MPWHSGRVQHAYDLVSVVAHVLSDTPRLGTHKTPGTTTDLEIKHARVIVILPREQRRVEVSRVRISEGMRVRVPAPEAQVETADASTVIVDDHDLLVMGPELNVICAKTVNLIWCVDPPIPLGGSVLTYLYFRCDLGDACRRCSGADPRVRAWCGSNS